MDLMPTFLEIAGGTYPTTYKDHDIVPLQGMSLMPILRGENNRTFENREVGWEAYGMDAYRRGSWKALRLPLPYGNNQWQLYNLHEDPGEVNDLAAQYPELTTELAQGWQRYAKQNGVIHPNQPVAYARPVKPGRF